VKYDDDLVRASLEETCNIAHERIESFYPDNKIRLPNFVVPKGTTAKEEFIKLANEGLLEIKKRLKLTGKEWKEYKDRLELELEVININGFAKYFLTMKALVDRGNEVMLSGPARGCFLPGNKVKMADDLFLNIEEIQIGDIVLDAFSNKREVIDTLSYDINEDIIELEFEDGKKVKCTLDHKFLTSNRGWVEAQSLTEDDDVVEVS